MTAERIAEDRLSLWQAAFVIGRRDFSAILLSRAFIFFLLGPLLPVIMMVLAGGIGERVDRATAVPQIGVAMTAPDTAAMLASRERLARELGPSVPEMVVLRRLAPGESYDPQAVMARREGSLAAVLTGTPSRPELTATAERAQWWRGPVSLIAAGATAAAQPMPEVAVSVVAASGASQSRGRLRTAQAGQMMLFLLTMFLAGMVLSNLVEEKANKVIEILAAAVPMDAVFLGKLFAMLAVSLVAIAVWASIIGGFLGMSGFERMFGGALTLSDLPTPGVGWPLFLMLGVVYFSLAYLLLGSIFLAIGSLATTVREVQTLSMPVTMLQVLLFFFASLAVAESGGWIDWAAIAFPLSSPFAMLARAATDETLWLHGAALAWQGAWVAVSIRLGALLFRRRVMQSGPRQPRDRSRNRTSLTRVFRSGSAQRL